MSLPEEFRSRLLPIGLAQAVGLLCGLVGVRLMSHLVEPADFGLYGIFTSLVPIGMWVVFAGLNAALTRLWAASPDKPGLLRAVLAATGRRTPLLAAATAGAAFLATRESWPGFALLLLGASLCVALGQYAHAIFQADRRHWRDLSLSAVDSVTRTALPPLLYVLAGGATLALASGFLVHALLGMLLGAWFVRRELRAPAGAPPAALPEVFAGPLFLGMAVAAWVLGASNRWIALGFFGAEEAGYFTLAANIAAILPSMLGTILVLWLQPAWFAADHATAGARARLARRADAAAGGFAAAGLALALLLHLVMPALVGPLVSARYLPALDWILPAGCFTVAVTTGRFYSSLLFAARQERAAGTVEVTAAVTWVLGSAASAALGATWFQRWLLLSPLLPWLLNRPLARRRLLTTA